MPAKLTPSKRFREPLTNRPELMSQMKPEFSVKATTKAWSMPRALRSTASWSLYGLGHLVSIPMLRWDLAFLYPLYRTLMLAQTYLSGDGGLWSSGRRI